MKHIIIAGIAGLFSLSFFSCNKSDNAQPSGAKLTISEPVMDQTYRLGDTVHIRGMASNETSLHGTHVVILNSNGDSLFHAHNHTHAVEIMIDESWVNTITAADDLKVIVSSPVNHEGEEVKKEITIKALP